MNSEHKPRGQMTLREKIRWWFRTGKFGFWTASDFDLDKATQPAKTPGDKAGEQPNKKDDRTFFGFKWWLKMCIATIFCFDKS